MHEQDPRFHAVDFEHERRQAPPDLQHLFEDHESIAWRRRKFERQAVLMELMRRAGPASYEEHFRRRCELEAKDPTQKQPRGRGERRMSVIAPESLWLNDTFFWYRVAVMINCATACMNAAAQVACLGSSGELICAGADPTAAATVAPTANSTLGL